MMFILGKKVTMSQVFVDDKVVPITVVETSPNIVTQIKKEEKDGYNAIQIGFERVDSKKKKKPQRNSPFRYLREFRTDEPKHKEGDEIKLDIFKKGDKVEVIGVSKGKGFQGVVRRWGFHGFRKTHGNKDQNRAPGSSGATGPARVFKGKKMPGRMGNRRTTVKNLEIVDIKSEKNLLFIKGAIPGARNALVQIVKTSNSK